MKDFYFHYWRVWVNDQGKNCQSRHSLKQHELNVFAEGATPIWSTMQYIGHGTLITLVLMPGELKEWPENTKSQWIIPFTHQVGRGNNAWSHC